MDESTQTMMTEFILYNNWANQQVLQTCQNLSEEQLTAVIPGAYGTIRATLEHIIQGEMFYVQLLAGSCPPPLFKWEDQPSLTEMTTYATQIGNLLLDLAQRVHPTDLILEEDGGKQFRYQAMAVFIQIINHGVEHRTNITTILNAGLMTPPDVDGWAYFEAHPDRFGLQELE
jgi:uncharacterized damage-inducible protein DinB